MKLCLIFPAFCGSLAIFWTVLLAFVQPSNGMSANLARAVEAELQAHVRRMELRAAEMHDLHTKTLYELRRQRDETLVRARRAAEAHLSSHKHGFIPGTGIGNRESLSISQISFLPSEILSTAPVALWEQFLCGKKMFLVAAMPEMSRVEIFEFLKHGHGPPQHRGPDDPYPEPLLSVYHQNVRVRAMTTFVQSYYQSGRRWQEVKIALAADDMTRLIVVRDNGTQFETQNMTHNPANVTDVKFFNIGLDSYLFFSQNDDIGNGNGTKSSFFLWSENGQIFDLRQEVETHGAVQVEAFSINRINFVLTVEKYGASTIWRYNIRQSQFRAYQDIEPNGAKSALYFTLSYESYIIFIRENSDYSAVYRYDGIHFQLDELLYTPAASSWAIVQGAMTCQDIGLLVLSSRLPWPDSLTIYNVSDNHHFVPSSPDHLTQDLATPNVNGSHMVLPFYNWYDKTFVVGIVDHYDRGRVVTNSFLAELTEMIHPRQSPYGNWARDAFREAFRVVENQITTYDHAVVDLDEAVAAAITLEDGVLEIGGDFIFNGTVVFNGTVDIVSLQSDEVVSNNTIGGQDSSVMLDGLERNATRNSDDIEALRSLFEERVTLDGNETIVGHKTFSTDLVIEQEFISNDINALTINGVDIESLNDDAVRNNIDGQTVSGTVFFDQGLAVDGDIILESSVLVNGFDMSNAVTETGSQTITGPKIFSENVMINTNAVLATNVHVNSIDISEEVVTLSGDHTLNERITFEDGLTVIGDIVTTSNIETIDVSQLGPDVVTVNGDFSINGSVTFNEPVTANGGATMASNVNNIDLADWSARAVRINVDTEIMGNISFVEDLAIGGNLIFDKHIDGFDLLLDTLLVNSSNSSLQTPIVPGLLFPYGPSENDSVIPPYDDLYAEEVVLSEPFPFFGESHSSVFVNINGILSFDRPVDQYTPSAFPLGNNRAYITPYWSDVDTRIGGTIYYRHIDHRSRDNDQIFREVNRICCSAFRIHFSATCMVIATWEDVAYFGATGPARNTFQAILATDGESSFAIFNFEDIEWSTGTASNGDAATGLGGFPALVGFNAGDNLHYYEVDISRTSAVVDIDERSNIGVTGRWLFKTDGGEIEEINFQGQTVHGMKTFETCLTIDGYLWVNGTLDGIDMSDIVTLTGAHTIAGNKTFQDGIEVEGHIFPSGTIDGVDLSMFEPTVMTRTTQQSIDGDVTFLDYVEARNQINVVTNLVNGVDIVDLASDAVYTNDPFTQIVSAAKNFTQEVNVTTGQLDFDGLINGYDMGTDFMDLTSAQTVTVAKTFADGFTASSSLTLDGDIDQVDINTLWDEAALTTRDDTIAGTKTFASNVTVNSDLTLGANLNTIDLDQDLMMVNQVQTVTGAKTFNQLSATADVSATSADVTNLNSQDWTEFVEARVTLSTNQEITGGVTFTNELTINGNIDTDYAVNGIDVSDLAGSIMYVDSTYGNPELTGTNTFTDSAAFDDTVTVATLDGVDINDMKTRAVNLNDGTQTITARKIFRSNILIENDLEVGNLLNYSDLSELNDDIVWINQGLQNVTGKKVFLDGFTAQQSVHITNTVNNVDISEEVLTKNRVQDISGSYTFRGDVTMNQDLNVNGVINNVNITEAAINAMLVDENQMVSSAITFSSDVVVGGSITVGDGDTVDTVDLSELNDMAKFKDTSFTLPNDVNFSQPLTLSGPLVVSGTVHGINFNTWADTVLTKTETQTITGTYYIEGTVQGDIDVTVPGSISAETAYGVNVDEFVGDLVMLNGDQNITGCKTLSGLVTVEGNVIVQGTVDGIDVSEEIVTLDGTEMISGFKTFNTCDVNTANNILLTGSVNGYEIYGEYANTLDFRDPQKVTGHKTFINNALVSGDLQVNGLVDGKNISQGFNLNTSQTIAAYHMFNARSRIHGNVTVTGFVQGENLTRINLNRITLTEDHTIDGVLTFNDHAFFSDDVMTDYLFDGVDLSELSALINQRYSGVDEGIYELACYAETQCERTEALAEIVNNFIDAIDYVEEIQIIPRHIRQFEKLAIGGVTFLAAAIYDDIDGEICTQSVIYRWDAPTGTLQEFELINTNAAVSWKHFTIGNENFLVVANSGHTECEDTPRNNPIYRYDGYNFTQVGSIGEPLVATSDIEAFSIGDDNFLVLTTLDGSIATVYRHHVLSSTYEVFQDILTGVTSAVESLTFDAGTFLIFTLYLDVVSTVYIYNPTSNRFDHFQDLEASHARQIEVFHYDDVYGFALAEHISVSDVDATFEVTIKVFIWNDATGMFEHRYAVNVESPGDVDVFSEGNFLYLSVVQEYNSINIYRYEGSAGFVKAYHIPFHGVRSVTFFTLQDVEYAATDKYEYDQILVAVAEDPFTPVDIYSRLLKVVNIGGSVQMRKWENMCDTTLRSPDRMTSVPPTC